MDSSTIDKWLWLRLSVNLNAKKGMELLEALGGIDNVYASSRPELEALGFLKDNEIELLCKKNADESDSYRCKLESEGAFILTPDDEDYPKLLLNSNNPPYLLFAKGKRINLNRYLCVAVVGTRNPTVYGRRCTERITSGVASNGTIIVSGMALGVDAIAHTAALRAGLPTVAVLGCGVDVVVPKTNYPLYDAIVQNGMIISEYPLGYPPASYTFPQRNRIIAGISQGTLVTEADVKSGSLITSDYALKFNREVFAIPGNIDSDASKGTNRLIRQGAIPVLEPSDITECFYASHLELIKNTLNDFVVDAENNDDEKEEDKIIIPPEATDEEKILLSLTHKPLTIDQISYATGISLGELNVSLLMMEVGGKIKKVQGNFYTTV